MKNSQNRITSKKIILVGDSGVGKTSLINTYKNLPHPLSNTIACQIFDATIRYLDVEIPLSIWDTAGEEKFQAIQPFYFRSVECAILVYDQTKLSTFENMKKIHKSLVDDYGIDKFVVADNKCDQDEEVPFNEAKQWCKENSIRIIRTSAATGLNVPNLFLAVGEIVAVTDHAVENCVRLEVERVHNPRSDLFCCS
ncbi:Ras-related protein Rab-31 [Tritrichomonas foetus]|uniref:Ras-related protein Rab-31 n=1 Tax=Tritrichomonas foetus TaxID=1144522 RepID=A0A1J4J0N8_9EUKA|nr:Ras-related protein Rab-31 [Tritrichomonas foetus]|eukprot:OHS92970.1 Ras-related protein Rab-31 [Tritrichomonas foetus]